ncbi:testis-specific serine/threonine-protein kinase 3-like, partial [Patella vulgata]|uniref:testis-specific serine/threonine-protein kinase 3-like n=1 Tax=Patella vulgata TaxID=6465 RepID=UPI0024A94A80
LQREISVMKSLNHVNMVNLHQVVESNDKFYLIVDLADQGDLLDFVGLHGSLNTEKTKKIFRQIVDAVSYCHQQNVAHRDLKLENILMAKGQVKLADFGFSRQMTSTDFYSQTFCGSVAYTAPEVLQGKKYNPFQSDIWSMGIILYAMLFGRLPFDDTNVTKMMVE